MLSILLQVASTPPTASSAVDFTWLFVKMLLILGIVTILAILMLKYAVPHIGFMRRLEHGKFFKVMYKFGLEPKKNLYVIKAGKRYLMIGTSDNAITLLTELDEKEVNEEEKN